MKTKLALDQFYRKSVEQKSKRFTDPDQILENLFDIYFKSSSIDFLLKDILHPLIHFQFGLRFIAGGPFDSFNSLSDAEKGSLLTAMGRIAIYIPDPRDPESVRGSNLEQGLSLLSEAMKLNYSNAYFSMGYLYHFGVTELVSPNNFSNKPTYLIEPDYKKAIGYYEQAIALDNNPKALYFLALMHLYGRGFTENIQEAIPLLERARALRYSDAIVVLGDLYDKDDKQPKEIVFRYYQEAAKLNNGLGMRKLADMYFHGHGVERDPIKACKIHRQAWLIDGHSVYMSYNYGGYTIYNIDPSLDCKTKMHMKYHYWMEQTEKVYAPTYKEVYELLKSDPEVIWDCIVGDTLLSDEEKTKLTDNSFKDISPILEVERHLYRSLFLKNRDQFYSYYLRLTNKEQCKKDAVDFLKSIIKAKYSEGTLEQLFREILSKTSPRINFLDGWIDILDILKNEKTVFDQTLRAKVSDLKCQLESKRDHVLLKNRVLFFYRPRSESTELPQELNEIIISIG